MRVGIVGSGCVGGALERYLKAHVKTEISVYDPPKSRDDNFAGTCAIFICVPADTDSDRKQNLSTIRNVIERFKGMGKPFFMRSTVLPGTCDALTNEYGVPVFALPEFLTMRTADEDLAKHPIVAGILDNDSEAPISRLELLMRTFPSKPILAVTNKEAELAKYAHNCFGALKVTYFNLIYEAAQKLGADYSKVLASASVSGFIKPTHTQVPGPDGKRGFGGHCLPKDTAAFLGFLKESGLPRSLLYGVEDLNYVFRGDNRQWF